MPIANNLVMSFATDLLAKTQTAIKDIVDSQTEEWSESEKKQRHLKMTDLLATIDWCNRRIAVESGRRQITFPMRRVNV